MEIDVTDYIRDTEHYEISASAAELGPDAGQITWRNAMRAGESAPLLTTPEQFAEFRAHMRQYGAWSREDIDAWSDVECNALVAQEVSHAWREIESLASDGDGAINWDRVQDLCDYGRIIGCLFRGDIEGSPSFGRLFYYLGT
jgi:hypothetical protein